MSPREVRWVEVRPLVQFLCHIGRAVTHLGRPMDDLSYKTMIAEL